MRSAQLFQRVRACVRDGPSTIWAERILPAIGCFKCNDRPNRDVQIRAMAQISPEAGRCACCSTSGLTAYLDYCAGRCHCRVGPPPVADTRVHPERRADQRCTALMRRVSLRGAVTRYRRWTSTSAGYREIRRRMTLDDCANTSSGLNAGGDLTFPDGKPAACQALGGHKTI